MDEADISYNESPGSGERGRSAKVKEAGVQPYIAVGDVHER